MSVHLFNDTDITAIANAIRTKKGSSNTMTVSDMPTEIASIPSGGGTDYMAQRVQGTLSSYTIPNTCTQISGYAFGGMPITSITIPNSITNIIESAFRDCYSLEGITIPASVTNIGSYAFHSCIHMTTATFNNTGCTFNLLSFGSCYVLTTLVNFSGATANYNVPQACFDGTALVGNITLGEQCTCGNRAFNNTNSSGTLYIHLTQTDSSLLTSKYSFGAATSTSTRSFNFDHCRLVVPVGMLSDYQTAFPNYSSIMIEETT